MARITVEDCIDKAETRFELVMAAAQRARKIGSGAGITVDKDNDKNPVIALREIAEETISVPELKEEVITNYQRFLPQDDTEESIDLMDGEQEWSQLSKNSADGAYASEEISEDDEDREESSEAPTLGDIAGV
tara:strand:- start:303 stop:701 length:399 start_codon:yes stop_codon:yes gene_type:complete